MFFFVFYHWLQLNWSLIVWIWNDICWDIGRSWNNAFQYNASCWKYKWTLFSRKIQLLLAWLLSFIWTKNFHGSKFWMSVCREDPSFTFPHLMYIKIHKLKEAVSALYMYANLFILPCSRNLKHATRFFPHGKQVTCDLYVWLWFEYVSSLSTMLLLPFRGLQTVFEC